MRNPDLPKLLRAIGATRPTEQHVIYEQAAVELEKLEKIYQLHFSVMTMDGYYNKIDNIICEGNENVQHRQS